MTEAQKHVKLTEVGLLPLDWKVATLGSLCNFENGDRGENYPSPHQFVDHGTPFINAGHLDGKKVVNNALDYISIEHFKRLRGGKVQKDDVLFCLRGSIGKFGTVGEDFGDGAIASSLIIVRPKARLLDLEFFLQYLGSGYCSRMIDYWAGGAAQPNLGGNELAQFLIAVPPDMKEQQAIAKALGDVDGLIASLEALIAKKRDIKQGAMQELLSGHRRLPGFKGEWKICRLTNVVAMKSGMTITSGRISDGEAFRCFGGNGLRGYTNSYTHDGEYVLIGRQGALCGNVERVSGKFFASEHAIVVTTRAGTMPDFMYYYLTRMNLNRLSEASAQPGLSVNKLLELECKLPTNEEEQLGISTILIDLDAEIDALEAKLAKTRDVKQGMMQVLLTGEVRLV